MTTTVYLDCATGAFPSRTGDTSPMAHCVRVAAIREEDGKENQRLITLVKPAVSWDLDPVALPYYRATPEALAAAPPQEKVARDLDFLLRDADLLVGYNLVFHKRMLAAVYRDGGLVPEFNRRMGEVCLMDACAPILRIKMISQNRWKSPKLTEAYAHFAQKEMEAPDAWEPFAIAQVEAVRLIQWRMHA